MSTLRWGRFTTRHPKSILAVWLLVMLGVVLLLRTQTASISTTLTLADSPAQDVLDTITTTFPDASGAQGTLVFRSTDGTRIDDAAHTAGVLGALDAALSSGIIVDRAATMAAQSAEVEASVRHSVEATMGTTNPSAIDKAVTERTTATLARMAALTAGTDPLGDPLLTPAGPRQDILISPDGKTAIATIQLTAQVSDLPPGSLDSMLTDIETTAHDQGLTVAASNALQPLEPPLGGHEAIGLAVAALVLFLTLGSLVLAGLPIVTALVGVFIGVGGAYALSANFEMTTSTPALGLMLGLAVGVDYALFVVHRRQSLLADHEPNEATAKAVATAGNAVLFAGTTVVIALLGLLTLNIGFVTTMAVTAAITVVLAVALAMSAVPAALTLLPVRRRMRTKEPKFERAATRWMTTITSRPWLTITLVIVGLGALAIPAAELRLGMPSGAVSASGSDQRIAYDAITDTLGEGANAPLLVMARPTDGAVDLDQLEAWENALATDSVSTVRLMGVSADHSLALFTVVPHSGPTAQATSDLVDILRSTDLEGAEPLGVTGQTALNLDLSARLAASIPVYLSLVAGLSLVVLLLVFRSVVIPLAATAGFLASIGATMGLVVLAFSHEGTTWLAGVDRTGPILSFLPIMATGVLYGLAMDYQVFLGTAIHEQYQAGTPARLAVVEGFRHAGKVVVAAAIIMVSVFAGFVLSDDTTIRQFGFALSAGILIDAFLIRMTLIPVVLHIAAEHTWWFPIRRKPLPVEGPVVHDAMRS